MTIEEQKRNFKNYTKETQIDILWTYINYVTDYPETHDSGYPVCFWEWLLNDFTKGDVVTF